MKRGKINRDTKYINEQKWVMKLRKRIKILYRFIGTNMNQQNRSHCHHYLEFREKVKFVRRRTATTTTTTTAGIH